MVVPEITTVAEPYFAGGNSGYSDNQSLTRRPALHVAIHTHSVPIVVVVVRIVPETPKRLPWEYCVVI